MSRSTLRIVFAVLAIGFFVTPIALRVVGVRANNFENKKFAAAPSLSQGFDAFNQTTRFLTDRMPLREQAVRANNRISEEIFGAPPSYGGTARDRALPFAGGVKAPADQGNGEKTQKNPGAGRVVPGKDGWLYLRDELTSACNPTLAPAAALRRWEAVIRMLRAHGKRVILAVPPDKFVIYPEHTRLDAATQKCADAGERRLGRVLASARPSRGVISLRSKVLATKRRTKRLLYRKLDTHWNQVGGLTLVKAVVNGVGGGRVRYSPRDVFEGAPIKANGDLTVLRGAPEAESAPGLGIRRPPGSPRVGGRTAYVTDSFGNIVPGLVKPYFTDFVQLPWFGGGGSADLTETLATADTVILVTVERDFTLWVSPQGPLNPMIVRGLRKRLGQTASN